MISQPNPQWMSYGDLWVGDDGRSLVAFDPSTGRRLVADGAVRDAMRAHASGDALPAWLAASSDDAVALCAAMATRTPRTLTRADVLRGRGFGLLFVELTARCNERCTHCYADAAPEREEQLSIAQIREVLRDARALGFESVQLTGGDPLLHRDLVEAAAYARTIGIARIEIFTNGLALSEALLDHLAPLGVSFAFSVYSHEPAVHDAVTRVPGSHARTLRAIRRCLERGLRARIGVTLMESTHDDGASIRASLRELGLDDDAIRVTTSRSVGRGQLYGEALSEEHGGNHGVLLGEADGKACVSSDGTVYPCIFARDLPLGNIAHHSLRAILEDRRPIHADLAVGPSLRSAAERLTCGECRLRDAMLGHDHRASRLVELRRSSP